jgi:hypothetical protein
MCRLDEITSPLFEDAAGRCLEERFHTHGRPPWSVCEARLSQEEYERLFGWAASVRHTQFDDASGRAWLVLFAFIAEWNRRHSPGHSVFLGLPPLFGVPQTRRRLFHDDGQPGEELRRLIRGACLKFHLRHAFDTERDESPPYYLSIQLQYGFSLPHSRERLPEWLAGHPWPAACQRLLVPDGVYRSRSFQRLIADLRAYRNDYLSETDLRRALVTNPWALAGSEDELVRLAGRSRDVAPPPQSPFEPLSPPRVEWDVGPSVKCRVLPLPPGLNAPRYVLRHERRDIARYYRLPGGGARADRAEAELPLGQPEAVVSLETPDGECVQVQTLRLWDSGLPVQVLPLGRQGAPTERLLDGPQVLVTSSHAVVSPEPIAWRLLGPPHQRRRWWLIDGTEEGVRVTDGDLAWTGLPPAPPPAWTNTVFVRTYPGNVFFGLGDKIRLGIERPADVRVVYALCEGERLTFTNDQRVQTDWVPVRPEMAGECRVRVGLEHQGQRAEVARVMTLPVRGGAWADGGPLGRREIILAAEGPTRPVRLFTDGPHFLMEGNVAHRLLAVQARPLGRVLGTGAGLRVVDRPYGTDLQFPLAGAAFDTGLARALHQDGEGWSLELLRPLPPGPRHEVLVWSPEHGVEVLPTSALRAGGGTSWGFRSPWPARTLLAAVVYEGLCLASAWSGLERAFFNPHGGDGLTTLSRLALVRWTRLPGLRIDPQGQGRPLIGRLAGDHLADALRVALFDEGLRPGLVFDTRAPHRELFDTVLREAFFDLQPHVQAAAVRDLLHDQGIVLRLLPYHPLLGCRVLQAAFLPAVPQAQRAMARFLLDRWWLELAGLPSDAAPLRRQARREAMLLDASRTLSEGSHGMDTNAIEEGLVSPALTHLFSLGVLPPLIEANLRLALGSASFRLYLALAVLRRLRDTLA